MTQNGKAIKLKSDKLDPINIFENFCTGLPWWRRG